MKHTVGTEQSDQGTVLKFRWPKSRTKFDKKASFFESSLSQIFYSVILRCSVLTDLHFKTLKIISIQIFHTFTELIVIRVHLIMHFFIHRWSRALKVRSTCKFSFIKGTSQTAIHIFSFLSSKTSTEIQSCYCTVV